MVKTKNNIRLLITGGTGFIGHHVVKGILKNTAWKIVVLDNINHYSAKLKRITDTQIWEKEKHRVKFIWHDLKSEIKEDKAKDMGKVDYIWHLAGSSDVERSIKNPLGDVMNNVVGTCNLLNFAGTLKGLKKMIYFSTDEVFGPAPEGINYKEWDRYKSNNPYAATKAGAEELCLAFHNTYKLPVFITHTMNVFGERQHPEKFIPATIKKVLKGEKVIIHADKTKTKPGSRMWIHARNVCSALLFLTEKGKAGDKYNIVGEKEVDNMELAQIISSIVGKPLDYEMVDFHSSRPGHDLRYSLDGTKMQKMGWKIPKTFKDSLEKTIKWYLKNKKWLEDDGKKEEKT